MSNFAGNGAKAYTVGADGQVVTGKGRLVGVLLGHTATTTLVLYDNTSAAADGTHPKLGTFGCAANDQGFVHFGDEGVEFNTGVFADWTAGVATLYIKQ